MSLCVDKAQSAWISTLQLNYDVRVTFVERTVRHQCSTSLFLYSGRTFHLAETTAGYKTIFSFHRL